MTLFEKAGGETALRRILGDFYQRVFADTMIGFFFRNQDRAQLVELEYQLTAKTLGADIEYRGRSIREAHANHPIMKGQFLRRLRILEETLAAHEVDPAVRKAWLDHSRALEAAVVGAAVDSPHCDEKRATAISPPQSGVVEYP
jgi:truncated hemoglobin YjbI